MLSTPHHTPVSPAHTAAELTQESQGSVLIKAVCPAAFAGCWAWHCGLPSAAQFLFRTPHLFRSPCARPCNRSQDRFLGLESILIPASLFASFSLHKTKAGACPLKELHRIKFVQEHDLDFFSLNVLCVHVSMCRCLRRPDRAVRSFGTGIMGICEQPDVGAGIQTCALKE